MVRRVLGSLPRRDRWVAVCRTEHLDHPCLTRFLGEGGRRSTVIGRWPRGHDRRARPALASSAASRLDPEEPLLIAPCDAAFVYDEAKFACAEDYLAIDCVVWTFRHHRHANRHPKQYGWVKADAAGLLQGAKSDKLLGWT